MILSTVLHLQFPSRLRLAGKSKIPTRKSELGLPSSAFNFILRFDFESAPLRLQASSVTASFGSRFLASFSFGFESSRLVGMADQSSDLKICHHCAAPLSKDMKTSSWTISPFMRDSSSMIASGIGGIASVFVGFNYAMPIVQKYVKGPMWVRYFIGAPPVIVFASVCAGLAGGAVPALAQLGTSSYRAATSSTTAQDDNMHKT